MKREFTIDAKIEIGKYTFDKLIETGYDPKVKEEVAKEYGITVGTVYKYLREYKERILEPKPTYEELELFKKLAKNATKSFEIAEKLLIASDEEITKLIDKYGKGLLISKINDYIKSKPEEKENIARLEYVKERIEVLNEIRLNSRKAVRDLEKAEKQSEMYLNIANGSDNENKLNKIVKVIREYINSEEYYPNYIFQKNGIFSKDLSSYIKEIRDSKVPTLNRLIDTYYEELQKREVAFLELVNDVFKVIEENSPNILEFYRMTHMSINKFKTFLKVANAHKKITGFTLDFFNNYFDKYIIGSYGLANLEEALKINYEYNGVAITPEDIKSICQELYQNQIPINKNSIIYTFEEKVSSKVNKR